MSVYFRSIPAIPFDELMDGQLEFYNIHVVISEEATGLQGPDGFVHVRGKKGSDCSFAIYGLSGGIPWAVMNAIRAVFPIEFVGEGDHRYYGFDTEEEYIAWRREPDWAEEGLCEPDVADVTNRDGSARPLPF
jgi:hypothetical protein